MQRWLVLSPDGCVARACVTASSAAPSLLALGRKFFAIFRSIRVTAALVLLLLGCVGEEAKRKAAGNVRFHNGDLAGAVSEYRAAVAIAPQDPNAHLLLGNALFEVGEIAAAHREYQTTLAIDPNAREARRGQATIALRGGKIAAARSQFEALVDEDPTDALAHSALGKLLLAQNQLDGAEQHLRAALAIVANDPGALYCLGLTLAKKREEARARELFDRLETLTPGRAYASYGRAMVWALAGKGVEAMSALETALGRGVEDLDGVEKDPAWAALKSDPRFAAAIAKARIVQKLR